MPKNTVGKWSIALVFAMFILFWIGSSLTNSLYKAVSSGESVFEDILHRPLLALSMIAGFCAGMASFVTGLVDIVKKKERAILVYISTLVGAVLTLFVIAEFLFPH